jgi:CheY-like chemotaxis protein
MPVTRALIVEDETVVRVDIETQLRNAGYVIAGSATSGEEAIVKARTLRPDIILMDVTLRGRMDGFTAARLIRQEASIPIVFVSAQTTFESMSNCDRPTFRVDKPFTNKGLLEAVAAAVATLRRTEQMT